MTSEIDGRGGRARFGRPVAVSPPMGADGETSPTLLGGRRTGVLKILPQTILTRTRCPVAAVWNARVVERQRPEFVRTATMT